MLVYTYVVDHGEKSPRVGGDTTIGGDPVRAVMFDDALEKLDMIDNLLTDIRVMTDDQNVIDAIENFRKIKVSRRQG